MWQRIQTLFLAVAIISLVASIFLPIWGFQAADGSTHQLYALHYTVTKDNVSTTTYMPYCLTAMLALAAATLAVISIRRYDNRLLQMKLGALNSFFMAGTIAAAVLFANGMVKTHGGGAYGLGLWIPGLAVICNLLANQFIRRDEKLVRDSDRLR
jgi:glucan phosphoethanolaminetransferase (alkaline phosphatase superfamily)